MPSLSEALDSYTAVIVTGGSSGIGKTFIERLGILGPSIHFGNLSRTEPREISPQLNLRHFPCDLSDPDALASAADALLAWLQTDVPPGKLLLINNSGFGAYGRFPAPERAHHLDMIDVNIRAVIDLTARLLPSLQQRGGTILNVASTAAFQPTPYLATYGATKAFLLHWSLALHEDLRGTGVSSLALCPGPTSTSFFQRAGLQPGAVSDSLGQTTTQVVDAALHALARGRTQVVSGWKNRLLTAFSSKLPKPLVTRLGARILARYRLKQTVPSP